MFFICFNFVDYLCCANDADADKKWPVVKSVGWHKMLRERQQQGANHYG